MTGLSSAGDDLSGLDAAPRLTDVVATASMKVAIKHTNFMVLSFRLIGPVLRKFSIQGYYPGRAFSATFSVQEEKRSELRNVPLHDSHRLRGVREQCPDREALSP